MTTPDVTQEQATAAQTMPEDLAVDSELRLERCLDQCDDEYDFEGLSLQQPELELCEQICHELYDQDRDDDWSECEDHIAATQEDRDGDH